MPTRLFAIVYTLAMALRQEGDPKATEFWTPVPPVVDPGAAGRPPSDAVVLFDGRDLSEWRGAKGEPGWKIEEGAMTVVARAGNLSTRRSFGDVQLHVEWRTPGVVEGEGQGRGNSGVFLMERYEVQVLDSYQNSTYVNGQAGAIYKQHAPTVNASRPPGEWQSYDIIFIAPRFGAGGRLERPATFTVFHNGVLIQNHVEVKGTTTNVGEAKYEAHPGKAPLRLQDHTNPVSYRNIWIREL
ncbi:MAG: 3-keto-disaccharide hydrolase [Vicinamibacteria bacterium]